MDEKALSVRIPGPLTAVTAAVIYFQVFFHYWFVKLLGGHILNTFLPVLFLMYILIISRLADRGRAAVRTGTAFYLLIPLLSYLLFASSSILLNEAGLADVKSYLIYIYSPALLFMSIAGLHREDVQIESTLKVLFAAGIFFSLYVAVIYSVFPSSIAGIPVLETNRGEFHGDTGGSFGIGDFGTSRYTIPGISSTTYGPMLAPMILAGLWFRKNSGRRLKLPTAVAVLFLIFCVLMTVSRGPLISLMAGVAYLMRWRWFRIKELSLAAAVLLASFFTFARFSFLRLFITFLAFVPIDIPIGGVEVQDLIKDPRLQSIAGTAAYIGEHPLFGMGMTNLVAAQESSFGKEHNNYLSIAASFGLPAILFYISFIGLLSLMLHARVKETARKGRGNDMGALLCAGVISLAVYLNFAPAEFHFIWIWFALSAAWLAGSWKAGLYGRSEEPSGCRA